MKYILILFLLSIAKTSSTRCNENPCLHDGACTDRIGYNEFHCSCSDRFGGDICQFELLEVTPVSNGSYTFVKGDTDATIDIKLSTSGSWEDVEVNIQIPTGEIKSMHPVMNLDAERLIRKYRYVLSSVQFSNSGIYKVIASQKFSGIVYERYVNITIDVVEMFFELSNVSTTNFSTRILFDVGLTDDWNRFSFFWLSRQGMRNITTFNNGNGRSRQYFVEISAIDQYKGSNLFVGYYNKGLPFHRTERIVEIGNIDKNSSCLSNFTVGEEEIFICELPESQHTETVVELVEGVSNRPYSIPHLSNMFAVTSTHVESEESLPRPVTSHDAGLYIIFDAEKAKISSRYLVKVISFFISSPSEDYFVAEDENTALIFVDITSGTGLDNIEIKTDLKMANFTEIENITRRYTLEAEGDFSVPMSYWIEAVLRSQSQNITKSIQVAVSELDAIFTVIRGVGARYDCEYGNNSVWMMEGYKVSENNQSRIFQTSTGSLVFAPSIRYDDSGIYICKETDGDNFTGIKVIVEGIPEITVSSETPIPMSDKIEIFAEVASKPTANVTWKHNDKTIRFAHSTSSEILTETTRRFRLMIEHSALCLGRNTLICETSNERGTGDFSTKHFPINQENYGIIGSKYIIFPAMPEVQANATTICSKFGGNQASFERENDTGEITKLADSFNISEFGVELKSGDASNCFTLVNINSAWELKNVSCDQPVQLACQVKALSGPVNLKLEVNGCPSNNIIASWVPGGFFKQSVEVKSDNANVTTFNLYPDENNMTISNLDPGVKYEVKISAGSDVCDLIPSVRSWVNIPKQTTNSASSALLTQITESTCRVQWTNSEDEETLNISILVRADMIYSGCNGLGNETSYSQITLDGTDTEYVFIGMPNSAYSVQIVSMYCNGNSKAVMAIGTCTTPVAAPEILPLPEHSENDIISTEEGLKLTVSPLSERNGKISCVFIVVEFGDVSRAEQAFDDDIFATIKTAGDDVTEGDQYFSFAKSNCVLQSNESVILGDGSKSQCSPYVVDTKRRRRREAGEIVRASNRKFLPGKQYRYFILTTTPSEDSTILQYTRSSYSGILLTRIDPVTEILLKINDSLLTGETKIILKNAETRIICSANGNPSPEIYWMKDGQRVPFTNETSVYQTSEGLGTEITFSSGLDYTDQGRYACVATNSESEMLQRDIQIIVQGVPEITAYSEATVGGERRELFCEFEGVPDPYIEWMIDEESVPENSIFEITQTMTEMRRVNSTMRITESALCLGRRKITCLGRNIHGQKKKQFDLNAENYELLGEKYLLFPSELLSMEDATSYCALIEGNLLTLRSRQEDEAITSLAEKFEFTEFLIGARKSEEDWRWHGREVLTYQNWDPTTTSGDSLACANNKKIDVGWSWQTVPCEKRLPFVCEIRASSSRNLITVTSGKCTGDRITVSWEPTMNSVQINVSEMSGKSTLPPETDSIDPATKTIDNLKPYTEYIVQITTSPNVCTLFPFKTEKITTGWTIPSTPTGVKLEPESSTTCLLTWGYDEKQADHLDYFQIMVSEEKNDSENYYETTTNVSKLTRTFSLDSKPRVRYKANVEAVSPCGTSTPVQASGVCLTFYNPESPANFIAIFVPIISILFLIIICLVAFFYWKTRAQSKYETQNELSVSYHRNPASPVHPNEYSEGPTIKRNKEHEKPKYNAQIDIYAEIAEEECGREWDFDTDYISGAIFQDLDVYD